MSRRSPQPKIADMEKRLAADPESRLFLPLAEAYRAAGRLADAERALREGLVRHPGHHSARASLGRVLRESGRNEEALLVLEQVRAAAPENLLAQRLLAKLRDEHGAVESPGGEGAAPVRSRPMEAARSAEDAPVPPSPADELSSVTLAELYLQQGDRQRALEIYRDVRLREPDNPAWIRRIRRLEGEARESDSPAAAAVGPASAASGPDASFDPAPAHDGAGSTRPESRQGPGEARVAALHRYLGRIRRGRTAAGDTPG